MKEEEAAFIANIVKKRDWYKSVKGYLSDSKQFMHPQQLRLNRGVALSMRPMQGNYTLSDEKELVDILISGIDLKIRELTRHIQNYNNEKSELVENFPGVEAQPIIVEDPYKMPKDVSPHTSMDGFPAVADDKPELPRMDGLIAFAESFEKGKEKPCHDGSVKLAKDIIKKVMEQREEILKAFVAKYGCDDPADIVQNVELTLQGTRWYVEKRKPEGAEDIAEEKPVEEDIPECLRGINPGAELLFRGRIFEDSFKQQQYPDLVCVSIPGNMEGIYISKSSVLSSTYDGHRIEACVVGRLKRIERDTRTCIVDVKCGEKGWDIRVPWKIIIGRFNYADL